MNFHATCLCDADKRRDPTGTLPLRDKFLSDLNKRWDALKRLAVDAIGKSDILGLGGVTAQSILHSAQRTPHAPLPTANKVKDFQLWIDEAMRQIVLDKDGAWTRPYIETASRMAKTRAEALTGRTALVRESRVRDLSSLTVVELQGIMEAVSQQTVRVLAHDLMANARPARIARDVARRIDKIGRERGRMMVAYMVVKAFNSSTLDAFRSLGIKKVGVVAEKLKIKNGPHGKTLADMWIADAARKTKQARHGKTGQFQPYTPFPSKREYESILRREANLQKLELVEVLTAGDEFVCQVCQDISEDGPYTIDEAESLIPAHGDCRCAFVPADDDRFAEAE